MPDKTKCTCNFSDQTAVEIGHYKGCPMYLTDERYKHIKAMPNKLEQLKSEFIRDLTSVVPRPKSEVRRRIDEVIDEAVQAEQKRGISDNWIKIDRLDIATILHLLENEVKNEKIIHFIKEYVYDPQTI